jgi:prolyl oligopeptidase
MRISSMRISSFFLVVLLTNHFADAQLHYPPTKTVDASDTYFGNTYKDPYRWLENLKDPQVEAWFKAQADLTDGVLARIPGRDALAQEWMGLDKITPAIFSDIVRKNNLIFYMKTLGGENVGKLYVREGWTGKERLLVDPSTYKPGTESTIESIAPSFDGKYLVLGFSAKGAGWPELRVLDVQTGKLLPDTINPSGGAFGWTTDNKGFFYDAGKVTDLRSPDLELNRKTRLHMLGTKVSSDRDIFSNESNAELNIAAKELPRASINEIFPGYIQGDLITVQKERRRYIAPVSDLKKDKIQWRELCGRSDNLVRGIAFYEDTVYAVTHNNAPRYKLIRTKVLKPDWQHAETVIPEAADSIQNITQSRDYLFITYSNGVVGRIVKYTLATGRSSEVRLPASGMAYVECPDAHSNRCLVYLTSWTFPATIFDYDPEKETLTRSVFSSDVVYPGFENLISEEVEVPGHDGTMIPLSIVRRKGIPMDGSNSCILEGYGAYGSSMDPYFSIFNSVAKRGVVLAFAHVRGGSEKGEAWYRAGYKTTKSNTWKDFISCGEYLVRKGYTSPSKLAATGTSAGGILISRAITERPDLFAAAICNVGVANAMRNEFSPNGPVNAPEFGTVKDEVECRALYEMDGVQHVLPGVRYPAVMCVGGWNDPLVTPWQPGKFAAALQNATTSSKPVLLKVNYDSGHFTEEKIVTFKNFAGQYAFLLWQTGHKDFQPEK